MIKVLNGVRYDTERSRRVCSAKHNSKNEDEKWKATLYMTPRSRRYFLWGKGGRMTRFAQQHGQHSWKAGEDIIPLEIMDAYEWGSRYCSGEELQTFFDFENERVIEG